MAGPKVIGNLFNIAKQSDEMVVQGASVMRHLNRADAKVTSRSLVAYATGSTTLHATFRESGASAGYTPASGNTFIPFMAKGYAIAGGAGSLNLQAGSTDVGFSSASAASNLDTLQATHGFRLHYFSGSGNSEIESTLLMVIPNGRYLQMGSVIATSSTVFLTVMGYEIDTTITSLDETP